MRDFKPLCRHSYEEAKKCGQLDFWRESFKENCACSRAIEEAVRHSFDGMNLQADCAKSVIAEFGMNRVNYVLANTIREKDYDGRFSPRNKEWAKGNFVPTDPRNWDFVVTSHPAVLDGFVDQVRKAWDEIGLYSAEHCVPESRYGDYTGKVMVIHPSWLSENYLTPEFQLFHAQTGFGCSPTAAGRKVFGTFLYDGEETNLDRSDFIGELKDEHLPDWAREKLMPQEAPSVTEQSM